HQVANTEFVKKAIAGAGGGINIYNTSDSLTNDRTVFFSTHRLQLGDTTANNKALLFIDPTGSSLNASTANGVEGEALVSLGIGVALSSIDASLNTTNIESNPTDVVLRVDTLSNVVGYQLSLNRATR